MKYDTDKVDDAVLALLLLGTTGHKAWKGLDLDTLGRLHERGLISDPQDRGITLTFTDEGLARAKRVFDQMFGGKRDDKT